MDEQADEPSDFEWRNLKKLAVLVLSSLVWKNKSVQDQIRPLGGIEAILNCCNYDEHNPYIREHAIMCLRFLMEGNRENQERIRALERIGKEGDAKKQQEEGKANAATAAGLGGVKVPDEVLDQQGYETYMDSKGQVMLRKRQPQPVPSRGAPSADRGASASNTSGKSKTDVASGFRGGDPKALEDLVQQVMRDLPTRVQGLRNGMGEERVGEEALKKLDRGFDGGSKG